LLRQLLLTLVAENHVPTAQNSKGNALGIVLANANLLAVAELASNSRCGLLQTCNVAENTTVRAIDAPYMYPNREARRGMRRRAQAFAGLLDQEGLQVGMQY
jgi:gamma-glutamyl phosphate reductase